LIFLNWQRSVVEPSYITTKLAEIRQRVLVHHHKAGSEHADKPRTSPQSWLIQQTFTSYITTKLAASPTQRLVHHHKAGSISHTTPRTSPQSWHPSCPIPRTSPQSWPDSSYKASYITTKLAGMVMLILVHHHKAGGEIIREPRTSPQSWRGVPEYSSYITTKLAFIYTLC